MVWGLSLECSLGRVEDGMEETKEGVKEISWEAVALVQEEADDRLK